MLGRKSLIKEALKWMDNQPSGFQKGSPAQLGWDIDEVNSFQTFLSSRIFCSNHILCETLTAGFSSQNLDVIPTQLIEALVSQKICFSTFSIVRLWVLLLGSQKKGYTVPQYPEGICSRSSLPAPALRASLPKSPDAQVP